VPHPWGWKTRPHFFNDDAVRISGLTNPDGTTWPNVKPTIGSKWQIGMGNSVWWPDQEHSGDVSFKLTTNAPGPPELSSADLNNDGIVNFKDLAILADQWLTAGP